MTLLLDSQSILYLVACLNVLSPVSSLFQFPVGTTTTYHTTTSLPVGYSLNPSVVTNPQGQVVQMIHSIPPGVPVTTGVTGVGQPFVSTVPTVLSQKSPSTLTLAMTSSDCKDCKPEDLPVATVSLSKLVDGKDVLQQAGTVSGKSPVTNLIVTDPITGMTAIQNAADVASPSTITLTMTAPKARPGDDKENKVTATVTLSNPSIVTPMYLPSANDYSGQ